MPMIESTLIDIFISAYGTDFERVSRAQKGLKTFSLILYLKKTSLNDKVTIS